MSVQSSKKEDTRDCSLASPGDFESPHQRHGHGENHDIRQNCEGSFCQDLNVGVDALSLDQLVPERVDRCTLKNCYQER